MMRRFIVGIFVLSGILSLGCSQDFKGSDTSGELGTLPNLTADLETGGCETVVSTAHPGAEQKYHHDVEVWRKGRR